MHTGGRDETVAKGEAAFYRLKDFIYSPRQREWIVKSQNKTITVKGGTNVSTSTSSSNSNRVVTNVVVPGALGGFTGSIKIPSDWKGEKQLRLKLTKESTYSNWLAASALAKSNPELFTEAPMEGEGYAVSSNASSNARKLADMGIVRLEYALDEDSGRMILQNTGAIITANGNDDGDEILRLYATEVMAPDPVDINCKVHDIDVSHRVYDDYYGDEMLEITISNYYSDDESIRLSCAMYLNDSKTPEYISLPYDPTVMASGKTTTITLPLKTLFDPEIVQSARFVFSAPGVAETADVNNEFTIYPGGSDALRFTKQPEDVTAQAGEDVSFQVEVAGGVKPYSYQWQVYNPKTGKWVDLKGFTAPTLSREKIEAKWDGAQFRCVVTDAAGTQIISQVVTLTIRGAVDTGDHSNLPLYLTVALVALVLLIMLRRRARKA